MVWMKGDPEGAVKTENFANTLPVTGIKENIDFSIGNAGCRPPAACTVKDGDVVSLSDMVLDNATRDLTSLKDILCVLTLKQGDKIIAHITGSNPAMKADVTNCLLTSLQTLSTFSLKIKLRLL